MQLIQREFELLFILYYINKGRNYIAPYLEEIFPRKLTDLTVDTATGF